MSATQPAPAESAKTTPAIAFENSYARLPDAFFHHTKPAGGSAPKLLRLNDALARELRIDPAFLRSPQGIAVLSGNEIAAGSEPLAQAYAGHQFGNFVPQLGDGRAVLLGEVIGSSGKRYDIQLKGSGPTRYSRGGDGRAAIGPVIREYLVSETMAALGIPTTRSLAAVLTGDTIMRERELPSAVLTRIASSHLRVGTFQYFAARRDIESLRILADYAIERHYPDARKAEDPYLAFYDAVVEKLAHLVASWMLVGFIHGVLNTDNTSIVGETIDYGPCAFIDAYHPDKVFSSIDRFGRYAYRNQPAIIKWNLARFAETLLPLIADGADKALESATASLNRFDQHYERAYADGLRRKLGLNSAMEGDVELGADLLSLMAESEADFTLTFRRLSEAAADAGSDDKLRDLFGNSAAFDAWAKRWRERLSRENQPEAARQAMLRTNPAFIPRNHRIEAAIREAEYGRYEAFHQLADVLMRPYDDQPAYAEYAEPPAPEERVLQTFCGT